MSSESFDISKRYWVFGGSCFYPAGGMSDFIASYDDYESAKGEATFIEKCPYTGVQRRPKYGWSEILDTKTRTVEEYGS